MLVSAGGLCRPLTKEAFRESMPNDNREETYQSKPTLLRHDRCSSMSQLPSASSTLLQHNRKKSFNSRDNSQQRPTSSTKQLPKYDSTYESSKCPPTQLEHQYRMRSAVSHNGSSTRHARADSNHVRGVARCQQPEAVAKRHNCSTGGGHKSDKKSGRCTKEQLSSNAADRPPVYEWDAKHTTSCYQPSSHPNQSQQHEEPVHHRPAPAPEHHYEPLPYLTESGTFNKYRGATYENLFTSPQLLFECRKYIEKSKGPLPRISAEDLPSNVYKQQQLQSPMQRTTWLQQPVFSYASAHPTIPTNQHYQIVPKTHMKLEEPAPVQHAEIARQQKIPSVENTQSVSAGPPPIVNNPSSFESPREPIQINLDSKTDSFANTAKSRSALPELAEYFAEDIIDVLFENKDSQYILAAEYGYTVYSNFADTYPFEKLFELADSDGDGRVSIDDLGELLSKTAKKKPNPVRQLFALLDMEKVGRVTLDEYTRFLNQISESEQTDFATARRAAEKVFKFADANNAGEISYWSLYLTKNSWEFQEFSGYLEQFEFSIEP